MATGRNLGLGRFRDARAEGGVWTSPIEVGEAIRLVVRRRVADFTEVVSKSVPYERSGRACQIPISCSVALGEPIHFPSELIIPSS